MFISAAFGMASFAIVVAIIRGDYGVAFMLTLLSSFAILDMAVK